jgi:DNA-binding protein HU-beta
VNKSQLIDALASRYEGNRRQAAHALDSVLDTITREVAGLKDGEKVSITGFGSFERRKRDSRMVRNPRTGERIRAKKTFIPKFNAGAELKAVVSGAKKLPKLSASTAGGRTAKKTATNSTAKKAPATKTASKKSTASKSPAKKSTANGTAKKSTATKTAAKKATATKAPARKSTAKQTAARTTAKKATATKAPAKRSTAKKTTTRKTAKKS